MAKKTLLALFCLVLPFSASPAILDKQKLLEAQSFWDNRHWDWYKANIPFFECPDSEITTTYYYRWELVTKHLTYGSPNSGYSFTEFIDRPFWGGAYGAISCPAGHQLYEIRWLRDPRFARDYARYWFRTPGAQPRRYGCWIADAVWAGHLAHPDEAFLKDLLPDLKGNHAGWEQRQFVPDAGLFWQNGHDDGMEFNINSRQTVDILRGADGFRPSFNSYMYADALAIANIARLAGDTVTAESHEAKAAAIKRNMQKLLWDPKREFFFPMSMRAEKDKEGNVVAARTLTYESGKHAGDPHGREEIGFVPWQFNLPDPGYEAAWKFLMDRDYFFADYGPSTVERNDPMFLLQKSCCWWSGQSWPYATTQTLQAMANLLRNYKQGFVTRENYVNLLKIYTRTQRKDGRPYIAEAAHPDTGSWEGHDAYNHSEHYFHSGYNDLIIAGLVGLKPRADDVLEVQPLATEDWNYFALDDVAYHGRSVSVVWDKIGNRYGLGQGLHLLADGQRLATLNHLGKIVANLPPVAAAKQPDPRLNFAVNNEGDSFPRVSASFQNPNAPLERVNDGNYWYHQHPPNRWTCEGSTNASDWLALDFGAPRRIDTVKLYFLDDGANVIAPAKFELEWLDGQTWKPLPEQKRSPESPLGHRANVVSFPAQNIRQIRAVFTHAPNGRTGLTEFEAWGEGALPYTPAPPPPGNLALNTGGQDFPKASASRSDVYGGQPRFAIDGKVVFRPSPMNRWTCYGSPNASDWLEVDFGSPKAVGRVELLIYDDRGGVQPPAGYSVQYFANGEWRDAPNQQKSPAVPTGNMANSVKFDQVTAPKIRVVFLHKGQARSGVTEMEVWKE